MRDFFDSLFKIENKKIRYTVILFLILTVISTIVYSVNLYHYIPIKTFFIYLFCLFVIFIFLYIIFILCECVVDKKNKKRGNILAHIYKQDEENRDIQFLPINKEAKKTYWVLGTSLQSISSNDNLFKDLVKRNIKIRLCMMDSEIAIDNYCQKTYDEHNCMIYNMLEKCNKSCPKNKLECKKISPKEFDKGMLNRLNVLIDEKHLDEFFSSCSSYKKRILDSYQALLQIKERLETQCGSDNFVIKRVSSFITTSMTIIDAEENSAKMIVEFHIPFTDYRISFSLSKKDNEKLFNYFIEFYNDVFNKAK